MTHILPPVFFPTNATPSATSIAHIVDTSCSDAPIAAGPFLAGLDATGLATLRRTDHRLRRLGESRFRCACCGGPVHIRVTSVAASGHAGGRRATFVHDPRLEPRECIFASAETYSSPNAIDGRRFSSQAEGQRHLHLKTRLCQMLAADPNIAHAEVEALVTGKSPDGTASWRRPDVLAVTTDGRRIALDLQIAPPLLHTIEGREAFYARQQIAWLWIVDAAQPERLRRQGMQDIILPQAGRILGFDDEIADLAQIDGRSRFHLLHVLETYDRRHFSINSKEIGLQAAFALAGFPSGGAPVIARDLRTMACFSALQHGDDGEIFRAFDFLAAGCGAPSWTMAQADHVPELISTLASLVFGRNIGVVHFAEDDVTGIVEYFLRPDNKLVAPDARRRFWAPLIAQAASFGPEISRHLDLPGTRTRSLLNAALAETARAPEEFQRRTARWMPLLHRMFPRLSV
jgi:hypothetical protein